MGPGSRRHRDPVLHRISHVVPLPTPGGSTHAVMLVPPPAQNRRHCDGSAAVTGLVATVPAAAVQAQTHTPAAATASTATTMAATPYMGWSSWSMQSSSYPGLNPNGSYSYLTEANVLKQADALATKLSAYGYNYVNIDAGWWRDNNWTPEYDQNARQAPDPVR